MIEAKDKVINGCKYTVTQMTARTALRMQAKLLKLLGPSASVLFSQAGKTLEEAEKSMETLMPMAVNMLVNQLDDKTFDSLVMELMQGVRKDGIELTPQILDMEFSGKLNTLFLVLQYVIEVNFGDFFMEGGILQGLIPPKVEISQKMPQQLRNDSQKA